MPDPRSRLENARLTLARIGMATPADLRHALEQAAQVSARTLGVSRVGVWLFAGESQLTCTVTYDVATERFSEGTSTLDLREFPVYANALRTSRAVAVSEAATDPRTAELGASYFEVEGIQATLDVPIFVAGDLVGVVCHEEQAPRTWSPEDIDFATSVADMLAVLTGQAGRLRAEQALNAHEEAIAEMRRMESLGRLAAGVAHDFSNILLAISLLAQRLTLRLRTDPEASRWASNIGVETDRGTRLVRQLLAFAREEATTPTVVNLAAIVDGLAPLLETLVTSRHALAITTPETPTTLRADRTQLEQVLLNLVTNARDALPEGGTIRVAVEDTGTGEVVLRVCDDGVGMDEATQSRVFEPFFTTKGGRGTGLGLSTVYGIVTQSKGRVELRSHPGEGTTVTIRFPQCADAN